MTQPLTVHADPEVQTHSAPVLASLPQSYAPGDTATDGVAVIAGTPGWPTRAEIALDAGAVAIIVIHPEPSDVSELQERTSDTAAPVLVLDTRWAASPVVPSAAAKFAEALPRGSRLESQVYRAVSSHLENALLEQLGLVRDLIGPVSDVRILTWSRHGYAAEGVTAGRAVDLSVICTDATPETAWVRLLTDDGAVELTVPSGATAEPARLVVTGPDGTQLAPTLYESGHRATWRRTRSLLATPSTATDLEDFASDSATARTAFVQAEG